MAYQILIRSACYGSPFGTKTPTAGRGVTPVCRQATADVVNSLGTEVRIKLKGEDGHRAVHSTALPDHLNAKTPETVEPGGCDLVVLAMQEPQYLSQTIRALLTRIAAAKLPCLSLINMSPLPCLQRVTAIDATAAEPAYANAAIWERLGPQLVTLCSPNPQAARPDHQPAKVLTVNPATNFKAAAFAAPPAERVDGLVQLAGREHDIGHAAIHSTAGLVDSKIEQNRHRAA